MSQVGFETPAAVEDRCSLSAVIGKWLEFPGRVSRDAADHPTGGVIGKETWSQARTASTELLYSRAGAHRSDLATAEVMPTLLAQFDHSDQRLIRIERCKGTAQVVERLLLLRRAHRGLHRSGFTSAPMEPSLG